MNKAEFLNELYREHSGELPSKAIVENTFTALCKVIQAELLGGGEVPLPGVGKLKVKATAARKGRNPKTGESINIPAGQRVTFSPSKELKEAMKS